MQFSKFIISKNSFPNGTDFPRPDPPGALCFLCCLLYIIINLSLHSRTPFSSAKCFYHSFFRTLLDSCRQYNESRWPSGSESIDHCSSVTSMMLHLLVVLVPFLVAMVKYSGRAILWRQGLCWLMVQGAVHHGREVKATAVCSRCSECMQSREQRAMNVYIQLCSQFSTVHDSCLRNDSIHI